MLRLCMAEPCFRAMLYPKEVFTPLYPPPAPLANFRCRELGYVHTVFRRLKFFRLAFHYFLDVDFTAA